jgi:hypothetical protein
MASQESTRVRGAAPPSPPPAADSGIELTTLFLSAVASAAAAYVTSKIWAPGTLFSAAMSPVIVALVKEGLRKPTEKAFEVVPGVVTAPSRWTRTAPDEPGLVPDRPPPSAPEPVDPDGPHVVLPPVVAAEHGPVNVYSTRGRRLRWRVAVITGLLGFAICVVLFTVPELISGKSIARGSGNATTIFGGSRHHGSKGGTTSTTKTTSTTSTTPTTTTPERTTTTEQPTSAAPAPTTSAPPTSAAPATQAPATAAPSTATPGATAAPQDQAAPAP